MSQARHIEKLSREHAIESFDCGRPELNRFLHRFAWMNQQAGTSRTYVGSENDNLVGYYTLSVGEVRHENAPVRITKGIARYPVPIMLLTRLAVSLDWQGRGVGAALLRDALQRTLQAAEIAGIRAFAVHAKDDTTRGFYSHFDFLPSPTDPLHLFLLLKVVRRIVDE